MIKKLFQVLLAVGIVALVYVVYSKIAKPLKFEDEFNSRKKEVVNRIQIIREAERMYKSKYQRFTGSFDTLVNFVLTESMEGERKKYDEDDSVAMAKLGKNEKNIETYTYSVKDSLVSKINRTLNIKLDNEGIKNMRYVPFTDNKVEYALDEGFTTASEIVIPVVWCRVPYKDFLDTVKYRQEVINLIDNELNTMNKSYAGVMFGSLEVANNEAGNWE